MPKFTKCRAAAMKDEGSALKQSRLARDEAEHERKRRGGKNGKKDKE